MKQVSAPLHVRAGVHLARAGTGVRGAMNIFFSLQSPVVHVQGVHVLCGGV